MVVKEQSNELFFVQLKQPNDVKRNILESLKNILELLQKFEKFKHIRHEKIENIQKLRVQIKEANRLLGTLSAKMPQTNLRAAPITETREQKPKHHHKKKSPAKAAEKAAPKKMTELEKLESELNAIEGKLKNLN